MRVCVYTVLVGGYELLNAQPIAEQSSIPFICLTDDPALQGQGWETRSVSPVFGMDPVRTQREIKIRPHLHLADFEASIYVDNSVLLTARPEEIWERYAGSGEEFAIPRHSFRETVLDEFIAVVEAGYDDEGRIYEQLNHYTIEAPEVLSERPFWSGILLRRHDGDTMRRMAEIWASHVLRYSRRDQLSVNLALRRAGLTPQTIEIDNKRSWFHTWPNYVGRRPDAGPRLHSRSIEPQISRLRSLETTVERQRLEAQRSAEAAEQRLAEQARQHAIDLQRASRLPNLLARRFPRLAELARPVLRRTGLLVPPFAASSPAQSDGTHVRNVITLASGSRDSELFGVDYLDELTRVIKQYASQPRAILEWGPGNSTLHFCENRKALGIQSIDTVESDAAYLASLRASLPAWENLYLHCCDLTGPNTSDRDAGLNYATLPLTLPRRFDVIFIDGRRRMECALTAARLCRPDTVVLLHDYRRPRYQGVELLFDTLEAGTQFRVMRVKPAVARAKTA